MIRKQFKDACPGCGGWLADDPERPGSWPPAHRILAPALSKSAPCKCCSHCQLCVTAVDSCSGALVAGATVTVKRSGTTVGACTTDATGSCCVNVPAAGTYTYTVVAAPYATFTSGNIAVTCPTTGSTASLNSSAACVRAFACHAGNLSGLAATISMGGTMYSGTTDALGRFCTPPGIAAGTWNYSITFPTGYVTPRTGTIAVGSSCVTANVFGGMATGYCCLVCLGGSSGTPFNGTTLSFSSARMGSCTLTGTCAGTYSGTLTYAYPGNGGTCPPASVPVTVTVSLVASTIRSATVSLDYGIASITGCPGGPTSAPTEGANPDGGSWSSCSESPVSFGGNCHYSFNGTDTLLQGALDTIAVSA